MTLMEAELANYGSNIPLIKIWCAAHRADLVWSDVEKNIPEVKKLLSVLSSISSYFHTSLLRMNKLGQLASENSLNLKTLPKLFGPYSHSIWCKMF